MKPVTSGFLAAALILAGGCRTAADRITIPTTDATPPAVTMDVFLPNQLSPLTVTPATPGTPTVTALANDVVTVGARGDDADGGVQDIQIWAVQTSWKLSGGIAQQIGPGQAGAPQVSNPDASTIGAVGMKSRLVTHNFDVKQLRAGYDRIQIDVSATAKNFHGGTAKTSIARVVWP